MRVYSKRSAVEAFYYLMAADGVINTEEINRMDEIGQELDPETYDVYRDDIVSAYSQQMGTMFDDEDLYDVIAEGVDKALARPVIEEDGCVFSRLLIWNMLVIALQDAVFHPNERRLIKHVARISGVEKSVYLEMEQLIHSSSAIDRQLEVLSGSDRPYSEIHPMVQELMHRREVICNEAKNIIEDETNEVSIEALHFEPNAIDKMRGKVVEAVTPVAAAVGDTASKFFSGTREKLEKALNPVTDGVSKKADGLLSSLKKKKAKNEGKGVKRTGDEQEGEE